MKRRKFSRERLAKVRSFYLKLFHGPGVFADRLNEARHLAGTDPAIAEILDFIDAGKHRELCQPLKAGKAVLMPAGAGGEAMTDEASEISSPVGVIAAGGVMPFAVADSLIARGLASRPVRAERRLRSGSA